MGKPNCHQCRRPLEQGEQAWADDWKVLETVDGVTGWINRTRYTCFDCEPDE